MQFRLVRTSGGLAVGNAAVDLVVFREVRTSTFRAELKVDDACGEVGRSWGVALPVMTFPYHLARMLRGPAREEQDIAGSKETSKIFFERGLWTPKLSDPPVRVLMWTSIWVWGSGYR